MEQRNNLGGRYTREPQFGKQIPNTQYRGYEEEETFPYGNPSNQQRMGGQSNQYSYTNQYRGNNPQHLEDRFGPQSQYRTSQYQSSGLQGSTYQRAGQQGVSQYQGTNYQGGSQYGIQPQATYQPSNQYGGLQQQGLQGTTYQSGQYGTSQSQSVQGTPYHGMQTQSYGQTVGMTSTQEPKGAQYNDRDRINDLLSSEKYLTEGYNISTFEAVNPQLHNTLKDILNDTHTNREALYQAMQQRGWYKTEQADQQQINQAQNQFNNYKNQLPF